MLKYVLFYVFNFIAVASLGSAAVFGLALFNMRGELDRWDTILGVGTVCIAFNAVVSIIHLWLG